MVAPVSDLEVKEDPIGTAGKPRRGAYQALIRGFNNRQAKNLGAQWPPYENIFWDEYMIEEEKIHQSYLQRHANWHRVRNKIYQLFRAFYNIKFSMISCVIITLLEKSKICSRKWNIMPKSSQKLRSRSAAQNLIRRKSKNFG